MAAIAHLPLENTGADPWRRVAGMAQAWSREHDLPLRDAIVLLPFAQHLPLARRAFAQAGGWMPRIETTMTLVRSLGPLPGADAAQVSFDTALDRLAARRLLRGQAFGLAWQRRDPRGFEHAVHAVVQTAQAMARAAAAIAPAQRPAYWARGRELLGSAHGPGGLERALAQVALAWAATSPPPATDMLFSLRPAGWIALRAGGNDALTAGLLEQAGVPCLVIDADPPGEDPLQAVAARADVRVAVCRDIEDEAQQTAAQVLQHLNDGRQPVALIAQDRLLVRRVRALLSRRQVPVLDETGWKLSTTRAGAALAALLRIARPRAGSDDWLDWLKSCAADWPAFGDATWLVQRIEASMRKKGWTTAQAVDVAELPERAGALWQAAQELAAELAAVRSHSFAGWIASMRFALQRCGAWSALQADDAGRQAIAALHLADHAPAAEAPDGADAMTLDEFAAWVDGALEDASFIPQSSTSALAAPVVVMPLARASLRPFAAAVLAGADEKRLGGAPSPQALLSEAVARELGLTDAETQRRSELLAFAHLLQGPRIDLLRRLDDGGEPLAPSPLLERLRIAMLRAGRGEIPVAPDARVEHALAAQPVQRPQPVAASLLPARLSASACEALRTCPYRFYALRLLALREADELDDAVEKRDYGTWLHEVLHRFHRERHEPGPAAEEETHLHAVGTEVQRDMGLDEAYFLPYAASFARFVPRYVQWLHDRDARGARWLDGERELSALPLAWDGIEMYGVIDRVDVVPAEQGPVTQLIDYKTGSAQGLRARVKEPQEDTQLAFYAALMAQQSEAAGDIAAVYLPLDESDAIRPIEHKDVAVSAERLVQGIGRDLARIRAGAPMPALGEGSACEFCEARGLCRRDHWPAEDEA